MIEFVIFTKAFSINAYHYATRKVKTAEARAWEELVQKDLNEVKELSAMADDWRKHGGHFHLHINCIYPAHVFYTQTGEISGKTFDCSNVEKPIQDLIFKNMGLNDKLVKKLVSEKSVGAYHYIEVRLELYANA
jgi:Endodeoxyribonuclease RusA